MANIALAHDHVLSPDQNALATMWDAARATMTAWEAGDETSYRSMVAGPIFQMVINEDLDKRGVDAACRYSHRPLC